AFVVLDEGARRGVWRRVVGTDANAPGLGRCRRVGRRGPGGAPQLGVGDDGVETRCRGKISLRRMTDPAEIAATALFLCSPGGHGITGQAISVCGNVEVL
ncbi:SDR family NAD(P)-dependent oxidoreductase, partial [Burkholderia contaminans]